MSFSRPTLQELIDRIFSDIKSRLGITATLRRSVAGVLARAFAGAIHSLFGYLDFIAKQVIYDTAEKEFLERWAEIWDITRLPATFADGNLTLTGTNGSLVPAGTILQNSEALQYSTNADATISGGTATVAVTALTAGEASNLDVGEEVSFVSPVAGVDSTATVATGGLTGGSDEESDDDLRTRFLDRIQLPPTGGSIADYIFWAKSVTGVTRVWVYSDSPAVGEVTVVFVRDNDGTGVGSDIVPSAGEIADVQAVLDVERPITATVYAAAPVQDNLTLSVTISPNTAAIQAAILAELADLVARESEPAGGDNTINNGKIELSHLDEAISRAEGEFDHTITLVNGGAPADVQPANGHMVKLSTVTFS